MQTIKKIGILGGGQLGKMLFQSLWNFPYECWVLDPDLDCPCAQHVHHFVQGDYNDYQTVLDFGTPLDVLGIEIEHVNTQALQALKDMGKIVIPDPSVLEIIQDKGLQKQFYAQHGIPTAPFKIIESAAESHKMGFPVFQKLRKGGYDGKGVVRLNHTHNVPFDAPSVLEQPAPLQKELAVMVAVDAFGHTVAYPVVEAVFDTRYNLLDYLISPAQISQDIATQATNLSIKCVEALGSAGIFAVEMFYNNDGSVWVNELAPRVHNSGHATIESCSMSQFEAYNRILMQLPLPPLVSFGLNALLNIVGEEPYHGIAQVNGLNDILSIPQVHVHWYGKKFTNPGRKMGHVTLMASDIAQLEHRIQMVKSHLSIQAL